MKSKLFVFIILAELLCAYVAAAYALAYDLGLILAIFYWEYLGLMAWDVA